MYFLLYCYKTAYKILYILNIAIMDTDTIYR